MDNVIRGDKKLNYCELCHFLPHSTCCWCVMLDDDEEPVATVVCIIGDSHVGKTSLTLRLTKDIFTPVVHPTLGGNFHTINHTNLSGVQCILNVRDTSGDESFRSVVPMFYRGAEVAVLVFDLTSRSTFNSLPFWASNVKKYEQDHLRSLILCGNKLDLADGDIRRQVSTTEGKEMARKLGCVTYLETSAKTGASVHELGDYMAAAATSKKTGSEALSNITTSTLPMRSSIVVYKSKKNDLNLSVGVHESLREKKNEKKPCCSK